MEILAHGVGRRKEAVAQATIIRGTGKFMINEKPANLYLHNNTFALLAINSPGTAATNLSTDSAADSVEAPLPNVGISNVLPLSLQEVDTIVKVKGGGLNGQTEAIRLAVARALCQFEHSADSLLRKTLRAQGFLTQDSRIKERRKYGLKKARKASQYHKR